GDSEGPTILHLLHSTASESSTYIELPSTLGTHPSLHTRCGGITADSVSTADIPERLPSQAV
ncbi:hypothetical protein, partial [Mycobacterium persicum]|uniref:hypothetical protein n=1 Tax=Mycobacterium persicum TaxID=1487726 RepID=UPI001A7E0969